MRQNETMDTNLFYLPLFIFIQVVNVFTLPAANMPRFFEDKYWYMQQRKAAMDLDKKEIIGNSIVLNSIEEKVNQILLAAKQDEIDNSYKNGKPFPPAMHFFEGKQLIEKSKVFQMIKIMPKGAALHLHDCSMVDINWLVYNVSTMDNTYMCTDKNNVMHYHFFTTPPSDPNCVWKSINAERKASKNVTLFNQKLYDSMSLVVDKPHIVYPSINEVWVKFLQVLDVANGFINYAPIFSAYFYEALREFREDNVQYLEVRGLLPEVYEIDGTTHNKTWVMETYKKVLQQFVKDFPDFSGGKIIFSGLRFWGNDQILDEIKMSIEFRQKFPEYFAGYDLVGQEDPGKPLLDYLDDLLYPSNLQSPVDLPYFFHAGETDWEGTFTDVNLFDAVLLNTTRIGHGYAISKHPQIMKMIKSRNIAVEVNPISNQVLKLVDDIRNHPASILLSQNFPIVISADDPAVWGAKGLSYDFYMTFMGMTGKHADLKVLKQLALNSLLYSAMSSEEKFRAIDLWKQKWDRFLMSILSNEEINMIG
ncbi:hypothetical protein KUTeg_023011 [Tegillarca granosa]|uniref:adenosine deaminase n=1 Tax=Tegillarca granosa TaxID=220873 RepID=A0ABQ9E3G9_TEGGR|nr:hypothetical protein KUTeg_023011 [Tegillarca granosa]